MAWVGTIIGAVLSLPLGFLGAKNVSSGLVSNVMRLILNAIRAFPELILAIAIFIPIAGLGPVAGALAIGIHSIGTLGKLTAEAIEGIDPGPWRPRVRSVARGLQVQRWGVLPQVLPEIVAFWLYRFEINIRAGAVLGVVGAGGIGFLLDKTLKFRRWPQAGMAILVVIVATILIDTISGGCAAASSRAATPSPWPRSTCWPTARASDADGRRSDPMSDRFILRDRAVA